MSPDGTLRVDRIWKRFHVDRGRRLLQDHVQRLSTHLRGRGARNPWRWVLRDISFELEPGEAVGIVGANGAGKSTLLKILAGVMFPHSGKVEVQGRVGALIEVMSGIHQELTGRENVLVYGTLLGLSRKQIVSKFDEIVAFAEVENAVDRQVKFYSSGMKMRLGFAVAAFLEPSVLIVDEVLAVGDSSFQQKCLDRMREVIAGGTTMLLVSHDLAAVGATARRGVWLADGVVRADGSIESVLRSYRGEIEARAEENAKLVGVVRVHDVDVEGTDGRLVVTNEPCVVRLSLDSGRDRTVTLYLGLSEGAPTPIFVVAHQVSLREGTTTFEIRLGRLPVPPGRYFMWFGVYEATTEVELTPWQPIGAVTVAGLLRLDLLPRSIVRLSPVFVEAQWSRTG